MTALTPPRLPGQAASNLSHLLQLKSAAVSQKPVSLGCRRTNSPHEFYRYPARFSPEFAQAAIRAFSAEGDLVLDPFVGGGTVLVEAMRLGRKSIGADINELATFVSKVKTTLLSRDDQISLGSWIERLPKSLILKRSVVPLEKWSAGGYLKDLDAADTWRIRSLIAQALTSTDELPNRAQRDFARCVILRTGQWALDMREEVPSVADFRHRLSANGSAMLEAASVFAGELSDSEAPIVVCQRVPGLADHPALRGATPGLVLTSPPYPGVYVIYHRWKLRGRREIPAPYWIANRQDGLGMASYTMNARSAQTLEAYFDRLKAAFADILKLCGISTHVVQIVGFNQVEDQLPRYLKVMSDCGFQEVKIPQIATADDGRLWRQVPGRRWWTTSKAMRDVAPHTAREVVLIHRPRSDAIRSR